MSVSAWVKPAHLRLVLDRFEAGDTTRDDATDQAVAAMRRGLAAAEARGEANLARGLTADGRARSAHLADDVDVVAVELAVTGQRPRLNRAERKTAVDLLRRRGLGCTAIADLLGANLKTIERDLADLRANDPQEHAA